MILFLLELKDKMRKKYPVFLMAGIMVISFLMVKNCYQSCDVDSLMSVQRVAMYGFIAIALLSIDFFQDLQRKNWRELMNTMQGGVRKFCCQRIMILLIMVAIWLLFATILSRRKTLSA